MRAPVARMLICLLSGLQWFNLGFFGPAKFAWSQTGRPIAEFDAANDGDRLPKYFKPCFTDQKRTVLIIDDEIQFRFLRGAPAGFAGAESDANLAGNFDIEIEYDFPQFPEKVDSGYGVSFGIWVGADQEVGDATLTRIVTPWAGQQVRLTRVVPQATETAYGVTGIHSKALKGRMMMRRVGGEIIALSADTPDGELLEWARFPFTDKPVRLMRLIGYTGGASVEMAGKMRKLRIRVGDAVPTAPGKPGPQAHKEHPMPQTVRKSSPVPTLATQKAAVPQEIPKTPLLGLVWIPVIVGLAALGVGIAIGRRWPAVAL